MNAVPKSTLSLLIVGALFCSALSANLDSVVPSDIDNCKDLVIDISSLEPGHAMEVQFTKNHNVMILRRTDKQISYAVKSKKNGYEGKYAKWWRTDEHPLDGKTVWNTTRSKLKEYFVFWSYSPINGYLLTYVAEGHGEELGAPRNWNGGFLDLINHAAYDITGRPLAPDLLIESSSGVKEVNRLTKLSLMIPKHKFSAEGDTLILQCK